MERTTWPPPDELARPIQFVRLRRLLADRRLPAEKRARIEAWVAERGDDMRAGELFRAIQRVAELIFSTQQRGGQG